MKAFKNMLHPHGKHHHHDNTDTTGSNLRGDQYAAENVTGSSYASTGLATTNASNLDYTTTSGVDLAAPRLANADMSPEIIERTENAPIIHKHIIPVEREEVVPVIEREREVAQIQPIIRPVNEHLESAVRDVSRELPEERREYRGEMAEAEALKLSQFANQYMPGVTTTDVAPTIHEGTIVSQPIVHEVIRPHIIEQVTPVIESEVVEPTVIHTRKPIYEHIVEAPIVREPRIEAAIGRAEWDRAHGVMPAASAASAVASAPLSGAPGPRSGLAEGELASHSYASELNASRVPTTGSVGSASTGAYNQSLNSSSYGSYGSYGGAYNNATLGERAKLDAASAAQNAAVDADVARNTAVTDAQLARDVASTDADLNRPIY